MNMVIHVCTYKVNMVIHMWLTKWIQLYMFVPRKLIWLFYKWPTKWIWQLLCVNMVIHMFCTNWIWIFSMLQSEYDYSKWLLNPLCLFWIVPDSEYGYSVWSKRMNKISLCSLRKWILYFWNYKTVRRFKTSVTALMILMSLSVDCWTIHRSRMQKVSLQTNLSLMPGCKKTLTHEP